MLLAVVDEVLMVRWRCGCAEGAMLTVAWERGRPQRWGRDRLGRRHLAALRGEVERVGERAVDHVGRRREWMGLRVGRVRVVVTGRGGAKLVVEVGRRRRWRREPAVKVIRWVVGLGRWTIHGSESVPEDVDHWQSEE